MAWTAPMTAVAGNAFTAAQFNTYIRDNLLETAPAKATTQGGYFVSTGANAITERIAQSAHIATTETTTSTSYADLATVGPSVTVNAGTACLVSIYASLQNSTSGAVAKMSYAVSGASTIAASDVTAISLTTAAANQAIRTGMTFLQTPLTSGSKTFTAKYAVSAGTGSFVNRRITVLPL